MMAEADDTAAKVCKALQDEHDKRAKYFKQGKVHKYALEDTVWVERHHKDVLSRHRQASWYVPGVIVRKVGQDVYAVRVGDNKILDRDHTQLRPRAPDPSGRPVTFEFTAGDVDSDDEGEDDDFTAEKILADKPDPGTPAGRARCPAWALVSGLFPNSQSSGDTPAGAMCCSVPGARTARMTRSTGPCWRGCSITSLFRRGMARLWWFQPNMHCGSHAAPT